MDLRTIAVIGAGPMGRGIAFDGALGSYKVILEDISQPTLERAITWIKQSLDEDVTGGRVEASLRDAAFTNLSTVNKVERAVREADLLIETVADEMEMKIELFTIFDRFAKPGAIFASNSSTLSITELAAVTFCPERCIGMRFFLDAPRTKRLELVKGLLTSEETVAVCRDVGRRMRKQIVVLHESEQSGGDCPEWKSVGASDQPF
jgi:3-hydroxybutyryl-CoA dehydrogenase